MESSGYDNFASEKMLLQISHFKVENPSVQWIQIVGNGARQNACFFAGR